MPKLKVPSGSLKTKDRPVKAHETSRKRHLSKEHGSQSPIVETKPKINGFPQRNGFHNIYGQSDDESANEWEGYDITDIVLQEETSEDELMETGPTEEVPLSPLTTSSSSDTPPSSPQSPTPNTSRSNGALRKRGVRCMECKACLRKEDCGKCVNCVDKPKFGGPGTRKQACVYRKCCNLLRNIPLKQPIKRTHDYYTLPAPKRSRTDDNTDNTTIITNTDNNNNGGRLIVSPLRPRKIATVRSKDSSVPTVQLHLPDTPSDSIGYPLYSISTNHIDVCVRCGSGCHDDDGLLSCQICCQPFHWFCVGMSGPTPNHTPFTCSRCVSCAVCGLPNECTQCTKCKLWFHQYCLLGHTSDHASNGDHTFKCVQCTKCVSCKADAPSKMEAGYGYLVSSLLASNPVWCDGFTYCTACYELKRKGNCCPVCGECYLDNDFDSKMMQCGRCDAWVHSHCDTMSNEDYEILSELPDTVEYMCTFCYTNNDDSHDGGVSWRTAIIEFKRDSYNKLLTQLSTSLGNIWTNKTTPLTDPLPTVNEFINQLNQLLVKCNNSVKTGSKQHRLLYTTQQEYNKSIEDLFPWYSDVYSNNVDTPTTTANNKTTPTTTTDEKMDCDNNDFMDTWPSLLLHDHCYNNKQKTDTNNNTNNTNEAIISNGDTTITNGDITNIRYCILCSTRGDQPSMEAGRLIPCGSVGDWIHVNCAIWSAEVYEDTIGLLYNVHSAISRGQRLRCDACKVLGATVGCCCSNCSSNYHYMCARKKNCIFLHNKEVYCQQHAVMGDRNECVTDKEMSVTRCILVYTDMDKPGRKITRTLDPTQLKLSLGSLHIHRLGILTSLSDTIDSSILLPHNYSASCNYWSVTHPQDITRYNLTILAKPQYDDDPIVFQTPLSIQSSPDNNDWPCIDTIIGPDEDYNNDNDNNTNNSANHWSSLSTISNIILTPSLLQVAYEFLKASECYPVPNGLKSFKIPKKTLPKTSSSPPLSPIVSITDTVQPPLDSLMVNSYRQGGVCNNNNNNMDGVCYQVTTNDGSKWIDSDLKRLWSSVVSELQEARRKLDLPFIPLTVDNVMRQFGLAQPLVIQLLEQLPNVEKCSQHDFHFHIPDKLSSWQPVRNIMNPTGSARSEQYPGIRSTPDMFSFLMSDHRPPPPDVDYESLEISLIQAECQGNNQRQAQSDLPVAMRYRNCQKTYKEFVNVFQSRIHGLGLFCTQEIDTGDMVIEYAGTVIRSILTDKREKYYESKDIGCYMFRIDNDDVVDATMSGNMARFINHSCEPNCYSKVVTVDNQKKIMIFALRKIVTGEELTYDYKFPIEDTKIPCRCGANRCRKTLN